MPGFALASLLIVGADERSVQSCLVVCGGIAGKMIGWLFRRSRLFQAVIVVMKSSSSSLRLRLGNYRSYKSRYWSMLDFFEVSSS